MTFEDLYVIEHTGCRSNKAEKLFWSNLQGWAGSCRLPRMCLSCMKRNGRISGTSTDYPLTVSFCGWTNGWIP